MPLGLNRSGGYLRGFPITLPHNFGTQITEPHDFGNDVIEPKNFGNPVIEPKNFGNPVPLYPTTYVGSTPPSPPSSEDDLLLEDGVTTLGLEDGSGNILLEN
jgi:hypothetical protein